MASLIPTLQTVSITASLLGAGGIATLSLIDIPILQAQPASRSLPSIRWLFSRGSHFFPQAGEIAFLGFASLAYLSVPAASRTATQLLKLGANGSKFSGYLAAAALCISILPVTRFGMIPTNFALMKMNEEKGGARSADSARGNKSFKPGQRSAEDSIAGKGEGAEFTDLSGPQTEAPGDFSEEEIEKVSELLSKFAKLNLVRATCMGLGGVVGLLTALAL